MEILGVYPGHNATAALLKDGQIVACVSEERFSGKKNHLGFPKQAIAWCLEFGGIESRQLDGVGLGFQYLAPVFAPFVNEDTALSSLSRVHVGLKRYLLLLRQMEYRFPWLRPVRRFAYDIGTFTIGRRAAERDRALLARYLGVDRGKLYPIDHHCAHAVTAYYGSPYLNEDALVLTLDGEGDRLCSTVSVVRNGRWQRIAQTRSDCSLGWIYLEATRYLGMKPGEDEYKLMGLAPYASGDGVERAYAKLQDAIVLDPKNPLQFHSRFDTHETYRFLRQTMDGVRFDHLAAAVQRLLEDRVVAWVKEAIRRTGLRTVVAGGGVFMNVKMNMRIGEMEEVERFFPFPTAGDESTPIGVCYWAALKQAERDGVSVELKPLRDLYLGPDFSEEEALGAIRKGGYHERYRLERPPDMEERIAELLAQKEVVARVAGRMEWGARALGNRSILAHPADPDVVKVINRMIKIRDFWMPFAPSILEERADDYVVNPKRLPARYMAICFKTTPLGRQHLKAAMHPYDETVRPQLVRREDNPAYHRILKAFERRTGIGAVLNTSYNLHGEPLVLGPKEALRTFERSGLRYLALGPFLLEKPDKSFQPTSLHQQEPACV